jgi:DNA invertase Pin-like site-specific DNA recombinase
MLEDGRRGAYDVIVAEALDRLSRDQEHIAGLYKQLSYAGVRLVTLSEGEINELHVGLMGTMNALFLKDLAHKTRRGLEGRIRQGKSGGGNAYGYDVVKKVDSAGEPIRGERRINEAQATVVRRILQEFFQGRSPRTIALALNQEGVAGPSGNAWAASTIHGNWRRGTGVLHNELYIGRLVWNRQNFIKDPATGKRQGRLNAQEDWIIEDVPHLRIIDQDLWERVKTRQLKTRTRVTTKNNGVRSERARRPRYLLSGLLKCGVCGGGFSKISAHHYGCSTARNKGTCSNLLTIRRDDLETTVLTGLRDQLMHPDCVKEFITEFHKEMNRLAAAQDTDQDRLTRDLAKTKRGLQNFIDAIKDGIPGAAVKDEMIVLEKRRQELLHKLEHAPAPQPRLHRSLARLYRDKVDRLARALNEETTRTEAAEAIRALIEKICLVPNDGTLRIELFGELAALINLANGNTRSKENGAQVTSVAGARIHLYQTFVTS